MAQVNDPYDLIKKALASLVLVEKLPQFEHNEVKDVSIIQALADKDGTAALPGILSMCIPAGRVPAFISAFKAAMEHRKQVRAAKTARDVLIDKVILRRTKNVSAKRSSDEFLPRKSAWTRWHVTFLYFASQSL
jgi:hypothetical protein